MSTTAAASGSKTLLVQYNSNGTQTSASTNASGGTGAEGGGYRIGEVGRIGTGSVSTLSSVSSSSSTTSTTDNIRGVGVGVEVGSVSGSIVLVSTSTTHNPVRANQHHHHHQMNQNLPILKPDLLLNDTGLFTVYCFIKNFIGASGTSAVAIDNKIEQAMDLVKSHLMIAVREEVEVLKEKIAELMDRINTLERENTILKANVSQDILSQLPTAPAKPPQNTNTSNGPVS